MAVPEQNGGKCFGIWREENYDEAPSVYEWVDANWRPQSLEQIVAYLSECPLVSIIPTLDFCEICNSDLPQYGWRSDGVWLWKASLPHYVEAHNVRIPEDMLICIRSKNYQVVSRNQINLDLLDWPFGKPGSK